MAYINEYTTAPNQKIVSLSAYLFFGAGTIELGTPESIGKEVGLYISIPNHKSIFSK